MNRPIDPMHKILLLSCNTTQEPYPVYPLGMAMISHAARRAGYEVFQRDVLVNENWQQEIVDLLDREDLLMVGLSIRNIDDVNYCKGDVYFRQYRDIVRFLREHTDLPIVMGGSAYSIFPKQMLDVCKADYGIVGEGEKLFVQLADALKDGNPPAERILRESDYIPPQELIPTERDDALAAYYINRGGMLSVQSKRGCPHRCLYCSYPTLEGTRYRFRSPKDVVDEIDLLKEKYNADYLSFTDSVFNDVQGKYLEIAKELVRRGNKTPWMAFFRPSDFTEEEVLLLKESGLHAVEWGTDATSDTTLAGLQKGFSWKQVQHSNRLFVEAGVANAHFAVFGGPGETPETVEEGIRNLESLENCVVFASIGIRVFPDTPIWGQLIESGEVKPEDNLLEPWWYFSPHVDKEWLHQRLLKAFGDRRDRVYPDGEQLDMIKAFHTMGYRGPVWNMILAKKSTRR